MWLIPLSEGKREGERERGLTLVTIRHKLEDPSTGTVG